MDEKKVELFLKNMYNIFIEAKRRNIEKCRHLSTKKYVSFDINTSPGY